MLSGMSTVGELVSHVEDDMSTVGELVSHVEWHVHCRGIGVTC